MQCDVKLSTGNFTISPPCQRPSSSSTSTELHGLHSNYPAGGSVTFLRQRSTPPAGSWRYGPRAVLRKRVECGSTRLGQVLNYLPPPVVAALGAGSMGQFGAAATRTYCRVYRLQLVGSQPSAPPRSGQFLLGYGAHGVVILLIPPPVPITRLMRMWSSAYWRAQHILI